MISRRGQHGFTVVETLIFLAVSAALFVSAITLVTTQQNRTEFSLAMQDFESQLRDVINDVTTGYYARTGNWGCRRHPAAGGPMQNTIQFTDSGEHGSNAECIFIGRLFHFAPNDPYTAGLDKDKLFRIYTVVGLRLQDGSEEEVTSIEQSHPVIIRNSDVSGFNSDQFFPQGIELKTAMVQSSATNVAAFGYITNFASYTGTTISNEARNSRFIILTGNPGSKGENDINNQVKTLTEASINSSPLELCFEYKFYKATVTVGSLSRPFDADYTIDRGTC